MGSSSSIPSYCSFIRDENLESMHIFANAAHIFLRGGVLSQNGLGDVPASVHA